MVTAQGGGGRAVLWFRNDLRLHDNPVLAEAAQRVKAGKISEVVPLYCWDPRLFIATPYGHSKTGPHAAQFRLESVAALREALRGIGSDLLVSSAKPEDAIAELAQGGNTTVLSQEEVTSEETRTDAKVKRALGDKGRMHTLWGQTLYHKDDLPMDVGDVPNVFTPFKNKVEGRSQVRQLLPTPQKGDLPLPPGGLPKLSSAFSPQSVEDLNVLVLEGAPKLSTPKPKQTTYHFRGGEAEALKRLHHYLWTTDAAATYFDTRNGMMEGDESTKYSPYLALGCLSPRQVYHELKKYEAQRTANKSTYWIVFELTWRDFYKFFTMRHGNKIFMEYGTHGRDVQWRGDARAFQRWKDGTTGLPLVDANMRELKETGWMSNRGRQNVASYLALDLEEDWRQGADWFESCLADYDVCSNWGNWVAAAGMTGGRINAFNITKQSKDYDLDGAYIKRWVPELAKVPQSHIHEPWKMPPDVAEAAGVRLGETYPRPIPGTRYTGQAKFQQGGGGGGGRGGGKDSGHSRGHRGGGRGGSGRSGRPQQRGRRAPSQFEQFG